MYQTGVMLDIETLGAKTNSIIVSLAAVKFSLSKGIVDEFTVNIDPINAKGYGLKTDKRTLDWWASQPKEAVDAWRKNPKPLKDAMESFVDWYGPKSRPTWAKGGTSFDFPILETSFNVVGIDKTPYHFRDCMDFRTVINLFGLTGHKSSDGQVAHCALDDCKSQCAVLIEFLKALED